MSKPKYKIMDFSYGNLRLTDSKHNTIVMSVDVLEKIINKQKYKVVTGKGYRYPHLTI